MLNIPAVVWKSQDGSERGLDITSRLLRDRIVMVTGEINDELAESVIAQLLYLESEDKEKPIKILVDSQGGSCTAGLAIISMMQTVACRVYTSIVGLAASMGIVIAASGEKGHRTIYPFSRVMVHQASGGQHGNVQDVRVNYREMEKVNDILMEHLASCCGKSVEEVKNDCQRDTWYGPEEIIEYGLVDSVATSRKG